MQRSEFYEKSRDEYRQPTFWLAENNTCLPHYHSALELAYLYSGEMEVLVDGAYHMAQEGDLVVISPYAVHRFTTRTASLNYVLSIPQDYIHTFKAQTQQTRFSSALLPVGQTTQEIAHCIKLLLTRTTGSAEFWSQHVKDSYVVRGQIYTILGLLLENMPLTPVDMRGENTLVRDVLLYLDSHYREALSQQQIAANFGYSCSHLSHLFNTTVGCSLPQHLGMLRARAAAVLLLEQDITLTEVAAEVGFESMRSFYRIFKTNFGVSPTRFLRLPQSEILQLLQYPHSTSLSSDSNGYGWNRHITL